MATLPRLRSAEGAGQRFQGKLEDRSREGDAQSKISFHEWNLVTGLMVAIDGLQFLLNNIGFPFLASVGLFINPVISLMVGLSLPLYLYLRGVNLNSRRVFSMILTFFLKEIPIIDSLPYWTGEITFIRLSVKAEEAIKKTTGVDIGKLKPGEAGALLKQGKIVRPRV